MPKDNSWLITGDRKKDFIKTFDEASRGHNRGGVFADFVEVAAASAHQIPYHFGGLAEDEDFARVEKNYMDVIKRYDKEEIERFTQLYVISTLGVSEGRADFLGDVYMELEISNAKSGQFFTPPPLARMMADMTLTGMEEHIQSKGFVTLDEPAAGAGVMVIEAANTIERMGFDPTTTLYFQATDVDRTCFNMAYFQLSTLGLCGEVVHGNSLSLEEWERRPTPHWRAVQAALPPRERPPAEPASPAAEAPPAPTKAPAKMGEQITMDFARRR